MCMPDMHIHGCMHMQFTCVISLTAGTTEPLTCVLYGVTGVFVLAIVVIVGICLIRFIRPRRWEH